MSLALIITDRNCDDLQAVLEKLLPDIEIQVWPQIKDFDNIKFAVLWKQPRGILSKFPNLKAVCSLGAGIDFITSDPALPVHVGVHRIVTSTLKQQMAQYILTYILQDYRDVLLYKQQQQKHHWQIHELPSKAVIGFLGLGSIGKFVAKQCKALGFETIAYTNHSNDIDISCYHHEKGIKKVMAHSDYIVCLLPLTNVTRGIINAKRLAYCQKQPVLIHAGRGEHLIEIDLLSALEIGQIKHAVLDVFTTEPLPKESPLWQRPDITITPHNAARSDIEQTADEIVHFIELF